MIKSLGCLLTVAALLAIQPAQAQTGAASPGVQPPAHDQGRPGVPPATPPAGLPQRTPPQPVLGPPPIEFQPEIIDLGEVRPNQRLTASVKIHNPSDKWLKIASTKADCACTSVEVSDKMIAPGQSVLLNAHYAANSVMGEKKGAVRVGIEGYDIIEVAVRAFVTMPVRADPPYITALNSSGQPLSGEYTVLSNDLKPFRILAINGEAPAFIDFDPAKDSPRNNYRVKWDLTRFDPQTCRDPEGRKMPVWFIVETDHPECPVFDLEIRNECNRRNINPNDTWVVQEKRILLGELKAGEPMEFEVVTHWKQRAPKTDMVKAASSESSQFTVELLKVEAVEDGLSCRIRITPSSAMKGLIFGNMRLHSNYQNHLLVIIGAVR